MNQKPSMSRKGNCWYNLMGDYTLEYGANILAGKNMF